MNNISGDQNPIIGKEYKYFVTDMLGTSSIITNKTTTYIWEIFLKNRSGKLICITKDGGKIGAEVSYSFSEKAMNNEYILVVNRATKATMIDKYTFEKIAQISVYPRSSKETKIEKVILFNKGAKDVNKASYADTLVARAYCIGMEIKKLNFSYGKMMPKGKDMMLL